MHIFALKGGSLPQATPHLPTGASAQQSVHNDTGSGAHFQYSKPLQPQLFVPSAYPSFQSPENASISWAERLSGRSATKEGSYQQHSKQTINIHADATDVSAAPDNVIIPLAGFRQPDLAPQQQAWPGQTRPMVVHPASMMAAGSTPTKRHAHAHTRTVSGMEMKDAYHDNDLDDDW